jgi:hypothetical protein
MAGALGLRRAIAHHQPVEGQLLERHAEGAACGVEVGVDEGTSACRARKVIDPRGSLFLIDPYPPGRLRISWPRLIARRVVRKAKRGQVVWIRKRSEEAASDWDRPIDFLFIDADHSFEGVSRHWKDWSPHIRVGGKVMLQGARLGEGSWVQPGYGPAQLFATEIAGDPRWELVDGGGAALVVQRLARAHPAITREAQPLDRSANQR